MARRRCRVRVAAAARTSGAAATKRVAARAASWWWMPRPLPRGCSARPRRRSPGAGRSGACARANAVTRIAPSSHVGHQEGRPLAVGRRQRQRPASPARSASRAAAGRSPVAAGRATMTQKQRIGRNSGARLTMPGVVVPQGRQAQRGPRERRGAGQSVAADERERERGRQQRERRRQPAAGRACRGPAGSQQRAHVERHEPDRRQAQAVGDQPASAGARRRDRARAQAEARPGRRSPGRSPAGSRR